MQNNSTISVPCVATTPQPKSADVYVQALRRHGNAVPALLTQRRHDDLVFFFFVFVAQQPCPMATPGPHNERCMSDIQTACYSSR